MNKDNISILAISDDISFLSMISKLVDASEQSDLSFAISQNSYENIKEIVSKSSIDLIILDVNAESESSFKIAKYLLQNNISILFLMDEENIKTLIDSHFNFSLVDYLLKRTPEAILKHKIEVYMQNILQKKATEYLLSIYDENVIASKTDISGFITYTSQAFCDICEYTHEELLGKAHNIVRHPDTPKETYRDMWKTIKSGKQWRGEIKNRKKKWGLLLGASSCIS